MTFTGAAEAEALFFNPGMAKLGGGVGESWTCWEVFQKQGRACQRMKSPQKDTQVPETPLDQCLSRHAIGATVWPFPFATLSQYDLDFCLLPQKD